MKKKFNGFLTLFFAFIVQITLAQEKTITGTVSDSNGPLPGVNVVIKNTTTGVETDFDGNYSIIAKNGDILVFSFVGMQTVERTVSSNNKIDVTLSEDENLLQEVVVTALGIKRKADEVTSSNQVVKAEELTQAQTNDVVQSLQGKVSGLQINTTSTGLNPNTDIILRGYGSISGGNGALIVIDNVISDGDVLRALDPNTIESMNILKGPAGAALYGVRGGNGVVIVTTKKGTREASKYNITFNSTVTLEEIAFLPERQDRFGQGWEGDFDWTDQGAWGPEFDGSNQVVGIPFPGPTDWRFSKYEHIDDNIAPFFNTGVTLLNSISLASGDSDGYLNFSANRRDTEGLVPNDTFYKNYFSLSTGKKSGNWRVSGIARYFKQKTDRVATGMYANLNQTPTNVRVQDFNSGNIIDHWTLYADNPYWLINNDRRVSIQNTFELQAEVQYFLNDNIDFLLRGSTKFTDFDRLTYRNEDGLDISILGTPQGLASRFDKLKRTDRDLYVDFLTSFDYKLTENLDLKANVGLNATQFLYDLVSFGGDNLTIPGLYSIDNIPGTPRTTQDFEERRLYGVFATATLGYKDYLFLELTARNDWDSALASQNRSFFYPSAGMSFIPTKAFPEIKSDFLHKAKVSAKWTRTGNANGVDAYDINTLAVQAAGYPYNTTGLNSFVNSTVVTDQNIVNEFITNLEFNVNLDLLKVNGTPRINLDAAYSFQTNEDQILSTAPSQASGATNATINVGETETKALEIDLGLTPFKTEDFEWNVNVGYSTYRTTVTKVTEQATQIPTRFYQNAAGAKVGTVEIAAIEGQEYPLIQGTAYQRDDQGRVILDSNGDPIRSSELEILGQVTPDYILNFKTGLKYKAWSLNAVLDYRTGHSFYSNIANNLNQVGGTVESAVNGRQAFLFPNSTIQGSGVANTSVLTGGSTPAAFQSYIQDNYEYFDENFVLDATALKVREVALNYDMPSKYLENSFIESLRLGVSGRNLYTFLPGENRQYNDPEVGTGLGGYSQTPPTRTYSFSVNLTF